MSDFRGTDQSTGYYSCIQLSGNTAEVKNNIFVSDEATHTNPYFISAVPTPATDYNDFHMRQANANHKVVSTYTTLAAYQAANPTKDANSKSKAVTFALPAPDLHLSLPSIGDYDLSGIPLGSVTTDIDGQTRSSTNPYMGADEHPESPLPIQLVSFTGTYQTNGVQLNWRTLSEINNYGFEVQRSANSDNGFASLANGFIPGNGTTNMPHNYSYLDNAVQSGTWFYRLKQLDLDGTVHYTEPIQINGVTGVGENVPAAFLLSQNYPNPFNPETRISYTLAKPSTVTLTVYTVTGQEIISLVNEQKSAGRYEVVWNATSVSGAKVASGMYFYRIIATPADGSAPFTALKKMMLLK